MGQSAGRGGRCDFRGGIAPPAPRAPCFLLPAGNQGHSPNHLFMRLDLETLEKLLERLVALFYVAMALAVLATLMGSPGWGFLFLLLGSAALVVRTALETQPPPRNRDSQSPSPLPNR